MNVCPNIRIASFYDHDHMVMERIDDKQTIIKVFQSFGKSPSARTACRPSPARRRTVRRSSSKKHHGFEGNPARRPQQSTIPLMPFLDDATVVTVRTVSDAAGDAPRPAVPLRPAQVCE